MFSFFQILLSFFSFISQSLTYRWTPSCSRKLQHVKRWFLYWPESPICLSRDAHIFSWAVSAPIYFKNPSSLIHFNILIHGRWPVSNRELLQKRSVYFKTRYTRLKNICVVRLIFFIRNITIQVAANLETPIGLRCVLNFQDAIIEAFPLILNAGIVLRLFVISPPFYCILSQRFSKFLFFSVLLSKVLISRILFSLNLSLIAVFIFIIADSLCLMIIAQAFKSVPLFISICRLIIIFHWLCLSSRLRHGYYHYAVSKDLAEVWEGNEETKTREPDILSPVLM